LILDHIRLDRRQLRHLVTLRFSRGPDLLELLRQRLATMLALHRQHGAHFLNLFWRSQGAAMAGMALSARFALALFSPPALPRTSRQPIGGWRFGRVGGILLACRQLPLWIGDLLLGIGDLLIPFRYLLLEPLNLLLLPLHLPLQFFSAGRMRVRVPTRVCMLPACAPSGSPIHPRLK
jgi:hypothetical protein